MEEIYMKARAKINLNLLVLNKREDNYHNIESVFQKINLYDEIYIRKNFSNKFELKTNIDELNNSENIIYKAYEKMKNKYSNITGIEVVLNKKIPMQAGMAGGSTDCASFILGMNKLFNLNLSKKEIETLGCSLGADVLPCLYNKAVLAEGIGDVITPIETNFKYYILIVKPEIACNTKEMYQKLDSKNDLKQVNNSDKIIKGLKENNINLIANNLYNVFEFVVEENNVIQDIKDTLTSNGALGSLMTGSGSCVYGIFQNKQNARLAYRTLKDKYQIYICTSYNSNREGIF